MRVFVTIAKTLVVAGALLMLTLVPQVPSGPLGVSECQAQDSVTCDYTIVYSRVRQSLLQNYVGPSPGSSATFSPQGNLSTTLACSGLGSTGVINIGQVAGSLNNQTILATLPLGNSQSASNYLDFQGVSQNNILNVGPSSYQVAITKSFQCTTGMVTVSQLAGNLNNQFTSTSLTVGRAAFPGPSVASFDGTTATLTNAELSAVAINSDNTYNPDVASVASVNLDPRSFQKFSGIANVNQVAGNLNTVMSNISVTIKPGP